MKIYNNSAKSYFSSYRNLPPACWRGIFLSFINTVSGGVTFFLSLYFVKTLHINLATAGLIISCYGFGTALGGIIGGKLSDKTSPFTVLIASLLIKAIGFLALIFLASPSFLMINLFTVGVATYSFKTANNVWVLNQCGAYASDKLKAINVLYTASNLGIGCSAVIVSCFTHYRFHYVFALASILLSAVVFYQWFLAPRIVEKTTDFEIELKIDAQQTKLTDAQKNSPLVWLALGCLFLVGLVIAQLSATYSIYLHDAFPAMGIHAVTSLFVLNCLLIIFFQAPVVNSLGQRNKVLMMGVGALLVGFGMFMLSISFVFTIAVVAAIVYTAGEMLFFSTAQLICYQHGREKKKGQSLGVYQSVYAASTTTGPAIGGLIYHHLGGNFVWYASGVIGVLCFILCYFLKKHD